MKINALVTAKSFSDRVPYKNFQMIAGKPLYKWTTDFLEMYYYIFNGVYFSSDRPGEFEYNKSKIKTIKRPHALCEDSVPHMATVKHAASRMIRDNHRPDYILLLQPTNPFRMLGDIMRGIKAASTWNGIDMVYSHYVDNNLEPSYIRHMNMEPLGEVKIKSGNFYLIRTGYLAEGKDTVRSRVSVQIPKSLGYNINVPEDFPIAEAMRLNGI